MSIALDNNARTFDLHGRELGYPTLFHDGSSCAGLFAVPSGPASQLIADSGFRIAEIAPGRGVMTLACVDYRDTECGTYHEIALAFFVEQRPNTSRRYTGTWADIVRGRVASFTYRLAVTTELPRDVGIFMWGFPKTLGAIDWLRADGRATATWRVDDREVLRYSVRESTKGRSLEISPPVYTVFEGRPHVSRLTQRYKGVTTRPGGGRLELGDHHIADELRSLGLPRRPLLATWNARFEFEMSAPVPLPVHDGDPG